MSGLLAVSGGIISASCTLSGTVVSAGGTLEAGSPAVVQGGTIGASGFAFLSAGASVSDASIAGQALLNDASATGDTVQAGGTLVLFGENGFYQPIASNDTLASGGTIVLTSGSITGLSFGLQATVDLATLAYAGNGTTKLGPNDQLTVIEGGGTASIGLAGNYANDSFLLSADGKGGTDVVLGAAQAAFDQSPIAAGVIFNPFSGFAPYSAHTPSAAELGAASVRVSPDEALILHPIIHL